MTATPGSAAPTATADPARVRRFSRAERAIHWIHAVAFVALLVTGVVLYLPSLAGALGSRASVKAAHLYVAGAWAAALLVAVAMADRGRLARTLRELESFGPTDRRWAGRRPVAVGRFNAGQKAHTIVQAAFALLFVVSGVLLLYGEVDTRFRLDGTILVHDGLTVIATLLVAGHLYLALLNPRTRASLGGAFGGSVPAAWAREHHAAWHPEEEPPPAPGSGRRRATTAALVVAAAAVLVAVALAVPGTTAGGPGGGGPAKTGR